MFKKHTSSTRNKSRYHHEQKFRPLRCEDAQCKGNSEMYPQWKITRSKWGQGQIKPWDYFKGNAVKWLPSVQDHPKQGLLNLLQTLVLAHEQSVFKCVHSLLTFHDYLMNNKTTHRKFFLKSNRNAHNYVILIIWQVLTYFNSFNPHDNPEK